jgi:hypothetical protein
MKSVYKNEKYRIWHNKYQNTRYLKDPKYREMKKRRAVEWRDKNIEKFRKYQRDYQRKKNVELAKKDININKSV